LMNERRKGAQEWLFLRSKEPPSPPSPISMPSTPEPQLS